MKFVFLVIIIGLAQLGQLFAAGFSKENFDRCSKSKPRGGNTSIVRFVQEKGVLTIIKLDYEYVNEYLVYDKYRMRNITQIHYLNSMRYFDFDGQYTSSWKHEDTENFHSLKSQGKPTSYHINWHRFYFASTMQNEHYGMWSGGTVRYSNIISGAQTMYTPIKCEDLQLDLQFALEISADSFPVISNGSSSFMRDEPGCELYHSSSEKMQWTKLSRIIYDHSRLISYSGISDMDRQRPIKLIIQAANGRCNEEWVNELKVALIKEENVNVFCMTWTAPIYDNGRISRITPHKIVTLCKRMFVILNIDPYIFKQAHIIGFHTGAHVAGVLGRMFKVERITGLSPPYHRMCSKDPMLCLKKTDASFVDVIQTKTHMSMRNTFGQVDFFPFGRPRVLEPNNDTNWLDFYTIKSYDAIRAVYLFIDSISSDKSCKFWATACLGSYSVNQAENSFICKKDFDGLHIYQSRRIMGYHATPNEELGSFYLKTLGKTPYCGVAVEIYLKISSKSNLTHGGIAIHFQIDGMTKIVFITRDQFIKNGSEYEKTFVFKSTPNLFKVQMQYSHFNDDHWNNYDTFPVHIGELFIRVGNGSIWKLFLGTPDDRLTLPLNTNTDVVLENGECPKMTKYPAVTDFKTCLMTQKSEEIKNPTTSRRSPISLNDTDIIRFVNFLTRHIVNFTATRTDPKCLNDEDL